MKNAFVRTSMIVALTVITAGLASAQEVVTMPGNASSLTTLTAVVSDQARITVPSTVTFNVTNIAAATVASGVSFLADNIVLSSASATLNVSLIGNAATFTAPLASPTWAVADVSWGVAAFTAGTAVSRHARRDPCPRCHLRRRRRDLRDDRLDPGLHPGAEDDGDAVGQSHADHDLEVREHRLVTLNLAGHGRGRPAPRGPVS